MTLNLSENNNKEKEIENGDRTVDGKVKKSENETEHGTRNRGDRPACGDGNESDRLHRLLLSSEKAENIGGDRNAEASNLLRKSLRADAKTQREILVVWAKENDYFYGRKDHEALKEQFSPTNDIAGNESKVYFDHFQKRVIKVTDYTIFCRKPLEFLENRITNHNRVFPDSAYKLLGIMNYQDSKFNDKFYFITEQPFIEGIEPTQSELDTELKEIGFKKSGKKSYEMEIEGGKLKLDDAHTKNFIKTKNGDILCIDSVIREISPDFVTFFWCILLNT